MNTKQDITLDILYTIKLKHFQNNDKVIIPKLQKKIEELKELLINENKKEIIDKIKELDLKIQLLINEKNNYFLENSKYLFEYFESKQRIDKNNTPKKTINSFFNLKEKSDFSYEHINECIQQYLKKNKFDIMPINNYEYNKNVCNYCNEGELIKVIH